MSSVRVPVQYLHVLALQGTVLEYRLQGKALQVGVHWPQMASRVLCPCVVS
jgi:hypothetical protein